MCLYVYCTFIGVPVVSVDTRIMSMYVYYTVVLVLTNSVRAAFLKPFAVLH